MPSGRLGGDPLPSAVGSAWSWLDGDVLLSGIVAKPGVVIRDVDIVCARLKA